MDFFSIEGIVHKIAIFFPFESCLLNSINRLNSGVYFVLSVQRHIYYIQTHSKKNTKQNTQMNKKSREKRREKENIYINIYIEFICNKIKLF